MLTFSGLARMDDDALTPDPEPAGRVERADERQVALRPSILAQQPAADVSYEEVRRDPSAFKARFIGWFGVVTALAWVHPAMAESKNVATMPIAMTANALNQGWSATGCHHPVSTPGGITLTRLGGTSYSSTSESRTHVLHATTQAMDETAFRVSQYLQMLLIINGSSLEATQTLSVNGSAVSNPTIPLAALSNSTRIRNS